MVMLDMVSLMVVIFDLCVEEVLEELVVEVLVNIGCFDGELDVGEKFV